MKCAVIDSEKAAVRIKPRKNVEWSVAKESLMATSILSSKLDRGSSATKRQVPANDRSIHRMDGWCKCE